MKLMFVSTECAPFIKTGGLGDVIGALPVSLRSKLDDEIVVIPLFKKVREKLNKPIALMLDTKGPEIRTGKQESGDVKVKIEEGTKFTFLYEDVIGDATKTSISYKGLAEDVKPGSTILVDDGAIEFEVVEIKGKDIVCSSNWNGL